MKENESQVVAEHLTVKELATRLSVSEATIYRLRRGRKIPSVRVGRAVRLNYEAVLNALAEATDDSNDQKEV